MDVGIKVGGVEKHELENIVESIIRVAQCSPHPKVVLAAFDALVHFGETKSVTVSNCTINAGEKPVHESPLPGAGLTFGDIHRGEE